MESNLKVRGPSWRFHITLGLFGTVVIIFLAMKFSSQVAFILLAGGVAVAGIGAAVVIGQITRLVFWGKDRQLDRALKQQLLRQETYKADRAEAERYVLSFARTQRILLPANADIRLIEAQADSSLPLLPGGDSAEPLDLLGVFTQPGQAYAIIGGQQTGKTFQARHIAAWWLRQGIKPVVIGPKWDVGEWEGCQMFGGQGDYAAVASGLESVRASTLARHQSAAGHKSHALQPVFFDDWTAVVEGCPSARNLIFEATTLYASVNVVLYFIIHADTGPAWGVERKGAALKDAFIKLFITPVYDRNGRVLREQTRGVIRLASGEERETGLFTGPPVISLHPTLSRGEREPGIAVAAPAPAADEARVIELWQGGERSYRAITTAVWGQHGDFYNRKLADILDRHPHR